MGKLEVDVEVKSPADKFWGGIKESTTLFPKIIPEQYKSIEILQGDGVDAGSVRLLKFAEGTPFITFLTEKIEATDEANKSVTYSVIDGEMTDFYNNFKGNLQVVPNGDGSLVKWSAEFEKESEEIPDPDNIQELVSRPSLPWMPT